MGALAQTQDPVVEWNLAEQVPAAEPLGVPFWLRLCLLPPKKGNPRVEKKRNHFSKLSMSG